MRQVLAVSAIALSVSLIGADRASAVCTAAEVVQTVSGCPSSGPCHITEPIEIDQPSCVLDFGDRALVVTEEITVGSNAVTIRAGSFTMLTSGSGNDGAFDARGTGTELPESIGGLINIESKSFVDISGTARSFRMSGNGRGGVLQISADGDLYIRNRIIADGTSILANGGSITLRSEANMELTQNFSISARGGIQSAGGGEVLLAATGSITQTGEIDVSGADGGIVDIFAGASAEVEDLATNATGDAGSGGCIAIESGTGSTTNGLISANGSTGEFQSGGCGGVICIDSDFGDVTISIGSEVEASGARPDGGGGIMAVLAGRSFSGGGAIRGRGPNGETCGGDICIEAEVDLTTGGSGIIDASGGDGGGEIDLGAGRDLRVFGEIEAGARQRGGLGGLVALGAGLRGGGDGELIVGADVDVGANPTCSAENGCGEGGTIDVTGSRVTVQPAATLDVSGPFAGDNLIVARELLRIQGSLDAQKTIDDGTDGINDIVYRALVPPVITGSITPEASQAGRSTCIGQASDLPSCIRPAPVCGNGRVDFPEACDPGPGASEEVCGECSLMCEALPPTCDDMRTCTVDFCDPFIGCGHVPVLGRCIEPPTPTATATNTHTETATQTATATHTPTATNTTTPPTSTPSATPTVTSSATNTPTNTPSATHTETHTPTPTRPTNTPTATPTVTNSATHTATHTATQTPTASSTDTPVDTPTPDEISCPGDCNGDGTVGVNELITAVNISLGNLPLERCLNADLDRNLRIAINELISAVRSALDGC